MVVPSIFIGQYSYKCVKRDFEHSHRPSESESFPSGDKSRLGFFCLSFQVAEGKKEKGKYSFAIFFS